MKKISFLLVLIMILGAFSSCTGIGDDTGRIDTHSPSFDLTFDIAKREYMRGETVRITARVKNISGQDLTYSAVIDSYYPAIELYCRTEGGEVDAQIKHEPIDTVSGFEEFTAKADQVGEKEYTFIIPDDAKLGSYAIDLNYRGDVCTYNDVLMITDQTSQNENSEYEYSPITVSSSSSSVKPIRAYSSSYIHRADGTGEIGDGLGAWAYFDKEGTDISTFPLLVYGGEVSIEIPQYHEVQNVAVYDLEYNRLNGFAASSVRELDYLSAGDYIVVLSVRYIRRGNGDEVEQYEYEDFFRLSVPAKDDPLKSQYNYSSVGIRSGEVTIQPIQCMLWTEEHKGGEVLTGDGFGVSQIIGNKEDHSSFPTLFYKGSVQSYLPVNAYVARVKVYDTDYNELDYSFDRIDDIYTLLPGEYLVVFYEEIDGRGCDPEIKEFTIRANECIFKFIVPESSIGGFSFADESKTYKEGEPGVKTTGFRNTTANPVADSNEAAERAKNECTIGYDTVSVLHDGWDDVWSITFYTRGTLGGTQTVYLDKNGITLLIVYGE